MKSFAILISCAIASTTHASFELLLVADNGSSTLATRKVHRFDPTTGVYLGSFGGFNSEIVATYLSQSTNSLFVLAQNGTTEWDYNTGLLKNSFTGSFTTSYRYAVRPAGDRILSFDIGSDFLSSGFPSGGVSVMGGLAGATYRSGMWTSDTTIVAFENSQTRFVNITTNAAGVLGNVISTSSSIGSTTGFGQFARNGGTSALVMATGTLGGFYSYTPGSATFVNVNGDVGGNVMSAATAHSGFFLGSNQGTNGRIDYYDGNRNLTRQFGSSVVLNPISMQTVLAPEPGPFAALGLGVIALLKRRRR